MMILSLDRGLYAMANLIAGTVSEGESADEISDCMNEAGFLPATQGDVVRFTLHAVRKMEEAEK